MAEYDRYQGDIVAEMPAIVNLHDILERVRNCDEEVSRIQKNRMELLETYHNEKDKIEAHYDIVVNRPMPEPSGPIPGRY
jgi:hypothetical protein